MTQKKTSHSFLGFSLLELMIVVAIIAILAAVAIPQYTQQTVKTRRTDGKAALLDLSARMERFYAENQTYVGATIGSGGTISTTNTSPNGFYTLSVSNLSATTFTLTATPVGTQLANDQLCGTLGINQAGTETITGNGTVAQCW